MGDIEVRPDEARAATARLAAAAEGIENVGSRFRSAAEEVASSMRFAPLRSALTALVEEVHAVPAETGTAFAKLATAGASAVDRAVAADQWGARLLGAVPVPSDAP